MSAHTPGPWSGRPLSTHTPGHVRLCTPDYAIYIFSVKDGGMVADRPIDGEDGQHTLRARGTGHGRSEDEQKANMRRFAAAWNAAHDAGLSTEALEQGVVREALDAIAAVVPYLLCRCDEGWPDLTPASATHHTNALDGLRAVLAKAGRS